MQEDPRLGAAQIINIFDQGDVVDESLGVLLQSGMIGGIVAACVLFFFLRRLRVTIDPGPNLMIIPIRPAIFITKSIFNMALQSPAVTIIWRRGVMSVFT